MFGSYENLESNSASLKSSRTRLNLAQVSGGDSARIKEKSLLGHTMCSEEAQKKILKSNIFGILGFEGVTKIGALYKVFPSKFVFVFVSKMAKDKLTGTEIQCRFGDSEICLNFWQRVDALRNGKETILVTIFLPELISDQAVRLVFSNFGESVSVFKDRHELNRKIRNGKNMLKSSPRGEIQPYCQGKFLSMVVSKEMSFSQKRWCCATCAKHGTCLARIALWLLPL